MESLQKILGPVTFCKLKYKNTSIRIFGDLHVKQESIKKSDTTIVKYLSSVSSDPFYTKIYLEMGSQSESALKVSWLADCVVRLSKHSKVESLETQTGLYLLISYIRLTLTLFSSTSRIEWIRVLVCFDVFARVLATNPAAIFNYYLTGEVTQTILNLYMPFTSSSSIFAVVDSSLYEWLKQLPEMEKVYVFERYTSLYTTRVTELLDAIRKCFTSITKDMESEDVKVMGSLILRGLVNLLSVFSNLRILSKLMSASGNIVVYMGDAHAVEVISVLIDLGAIVESKYFNYTNQYVCI